MAFQTDQRVKVRTGEQGTIVGQPDSDPIVLIDGHEHAEVLYRSEVSANVKPGSTHVC